MWRTAILLIITLVVVPLMAFYLDDPLTALQTGMLRQLLTVYALAALACFAVSTLTGNHSQVDKLWSIMPPVYAWMVAHGSGYEPRVLLLAILITIWGARLTWNFGRKGGYSRKFWTGEEDYRWAVLRRKPEFQPAWKWTLFNLFFISLYQMGLILLMTLPILKAVGGGRLTFWDGLLALAFLIGVAIETIADNQQWNFQREKHRRMNAGITPAGPYGKGFLDRGLFAWSRHPNYAAEQAVWVTVYLFTIPATGHWVNWSAGGFLLLLLLFRGSSDFSEEISASKYPEYAEYQKRVGRFVPRWGKRLNEH